MQVADLMTTKVFTVGPHDLIDRVFYLTHYEKIRHLPVIEKGKLIGIVSDRDLYKAMGPKTHSNVTEPKQDRGLEHVLAEKVTHIMRRAVHTTTPETPASVAAALMVEHRVGALPVVENNKLVGIVSATDILRVFSKIESRNEDSKKPMRESHAVH